VEKEKSVIHTEEQTSDASMTVSDSSITINPAYEENNIGSEEELKKSKEYEKKILTKMLVLLLSGILYFITRAVSRNSDASYETIDVIIFLSTVVSIVGFGTFLRKKNKQSKETNSWEQPTLMRDIQTKKKIYDFLDLLVIVPLCAFLVTFLFAWVFMFPVQGPSMNPNVESGEQMIAIVSNNVSRFDIVVIQIDPNFYNHDVKERFLKRIIGMPGETLSHDGFNLFVNGVLVEEPFLRDEYGNLKKDKFNNFYITPSFNFIVGESNDVCRFKNGQSISICPVEGGVMIIPEDYYFVLGDNRPNSKDSPDIGLVRKEDIIGIAKYHVHSLFDWRKIE